MKVYLIKASAGSAFSEYKKMTGGPPQNIFSAAAATPEGIEIEIADETVGMKTRFSSDADVIAIFMSTPDALRAYEIADKFRKKGRVVVLGGLHTAFCQDEALEHADAIMVGEVEGIWEELLSDVRAGNLKRRYQRTEPFDLAELKPYPTHLVPMRHYNYTWSVVVSRGCPFQCAFCLVHRFAGKIRYRPIENIVEEIKACPVDWIELHSDNLTANREYALELFRALKPLKKSFFAETTILLGKDEELLKAARDAGIKMVLVGIETISKEALKDQGKGFVKPEEIKGLVKKIQSYGIQVVGDFLFGFDAHDKNIFQDTLEYIEDIGFDDIYPHLVIPFPGSKTFDELEKEGRILTKDWSKYDGTHAVLQPMKMSPKELEEGTYWVWRQWEKIKKKRKAGIMTALPKKNEKPTAENLKLPGSRPWKSILALCVIAVGFVFDIYWIWGVLFIIWAISDLRNGWTYLLEVIQRSTNPILYWIIVVMWLGLGIWTLFFSPVSYWNTDPAISIGTPQIHFENTPAKTVSQREPHVGAALAKEAPKDKAATSPKSIEPKGEKKSRTAQAVQEPPIDGPKDDKLVRSERFGVVVKIPNGWTIERNTDAQSELIELAAPGDRAYMSVICMDMQLKVPLDEFVSYMQGQLKEQMPFLETGRRKRVTPGNGSADSDNSSALFEYPGTYKGADIKAIVRYIVRGDQGFAFVGMYESSDLPMEKTVRKALENISLGDSAGREDESGH